MAIRPVFMARSAKPFVQTEDVAFKYYAGFAVSQAQKSIASLHAAFVERHPAYHGRILEISTKSEQELGVWLSAFNLRCRLGTEEYPVENVFQAGKCFENGCRYTELLTVPPQAVKRDPRLRDSGRILAFRLGDITFPTSPATFFYDWIYVNAVNRHEDLAEELLRYDAFTDIAFNPAKSLNCQARAAALFVALRRTNLLNAVLVDPERFRVAVYP